VSLTFVDTNVLVYMRDPRDPDKQRTAFDWVAALARRRAGRLSWQVLLEFYAVATHPKKLAMPAALAQADVLAWRTWNPVAPDAELLRLAWGLQAAHSLSWWDATIVAAALRAECETLLSEDLQAGQVFDSRLTVLDPFTAGAPSP
jgi:predicted nucleic acid-binding protein